MSLYSSWDIERAIQLFMGRRTSLSLPGPSCTVESMHRHCWREREQCACHSDTQSSANQGMQLGSVSQPWSSTWIQTQAAIHRYISSVPQSTLHYKAKERAIQSTGPFVSERILFTWKYPYFNVFLNRSQNMFCVKSCKDHSLEI